jgi:formiminoglutamase
MVLFEALRGVDVNQLVASRDGEIKLGQCVKSYDDFDSFTGKYVVIGMEESVGPQANLGLSGAENGFKSFLSRFLNVQSNRFLEGGEVLVYGVLKVENAKNVDTNRGLVEELDGLLVKHLEVIYQKGCIPILIGGGHNNAYPLIVAASNVFNSPINVINCDPHADYRLLEGRHSGNSFSYAKSEGKLGYYNVLGLHQSYNSEEMLVRMEKDGCDFTFFDDYLNGMGDLLFDVDRFLVKNDDCYYGVELDLDAIKGMPSSAYTFSGVSVEDARRYVVKLAKEKHVVYLHLPEGAPKDIREEVIVGKTLTYLVTDFIKNNKKIEC